MSKQNLSRNQETSLQYEENPSSLLLYSDVAVYGPALTSWCGCLQALLKIPVPYKLDEKQCRFDWQGRV